MPDRYLQRDRAAIAETEEIGFFDVQVIQQRRSVVRRLLEAERPVGNVRRVPVALLLERDDLPVTRKLRQDVAERGLDCVAATMQQYEWWPRSVGNAVNLKVNSQAVDGSIADLN